jgi:hypothetical protein
MIKSAARHMWAMDGYPENEDKVLQRSFTKHEEIIFQKALKKVCPKYFEESPYDICWSRVFTLARSNGLDVDVY